MKEGGCLILKLTENQTMQSDMGSIFLQETHVKFAGKINKLISKPTGP